MRPPPPNDPLLSTAYEVVARLCLSVILFKGSIHCDHYKWYIEPQYTGPPSHTRTWDLTVQSFRPPLHPTSDLPVQGPPSLLSPGPPQSCSNLFIMNHVNFAIGHFASSWNNFLVHCLRPHAVRYDCTVLIATVRYFGRFVVSSFLCFVKKTDRRHKTT